MTEPGLTPEQREARVAELRLQADQAVAGLRQQMAAVQEAQGRALGVTAQATSRDGGVTVTVDATGVVTAIAFTPGALTSTPDRLAAATVATIQQAAAQARAAMTAQLSPVTAAGAEVLAAARGNVPGLADLVVPQVPRTAADPGAPAFGAPADRPRPAEPPRPVEQPRGAAPPPRRLDEDDEGGPIMREGSW